MKNLLLLCLSMVFAFSMGYSQENYVVESQTQKSTNEDQSIRKSNEPWVIQFNQTVTPACSAPIGIACDGDYFYTGSPIKPIIFKFNFNHQIIDSFDISGMPSLTASKVSAYMVGLTYDGTYFYMVHGTDTIYQIDLGTKSVTATIPLTSGTNPLGIAYAPDANGGAGGFWVSLYGSYGIKLFSRTGTALKTITSADFKYAGGDYIWALAYDTITEGGPFVYALERFPQNILRINPDTKKICDPIHYVGEDIPALANYYPYGIYVQKGVFSPSSSTLGVFFMARNHVGYDLASTELAEVGLRIENSDMKTSYKVGEAFTVSANVYRSGKATITSYDYNYSVNGIKYTQSVTGASISEVYPRTVINHGTTFTPDSISTYNVKIWVSNINGNASICSDTLSLSFKSFVKFAQRKVLHEIFSSSTCPPCNAGNTVMMGIFDANPDKFACVKYQMSWPGTGDPYYTAEGGVRRSYYGVSSVPYVAVDGIYYNGSPSTYTSALLNIEYNEPAFVDFRATFEYDGAQKYTSNITVMPLKSFTGSNRLFVALVEKETFNNVKTNGETEFHYVFKKFMSSSSGKTITLKEDEHLSYDFSYEFIGDYRLPANGLDASIINHTIEHSVESFDNIMAVYWIQNFTTKEVLQAGWVDVTTSSVKDVANNENKIIIYPNPTQGMVTVISTNEFTNIKLVNILGQVVYNSKVTATEYSFNTSLLQPGLYIVQLETQKGMVNRKLSIR